MRVEDDLITRLDTKCKENKAQRTSYLNMAKKHAGDSLSYESYLQKAETVDMSFCKTAQKDKEIIKKSRGNGK
jgi:hypothetical protein